MGLISKCWQGWLLPEAPGRGESMPGLLASGGCLNSSRRNLSRERYGLFLTSLLSVIITPTTNSDLSLIRGLLILLGPLE